jgi:hypothetical protein
MAAIALKPLPVRSSSEPYQKQAANLITAFAGSDPGAVRSIRQHHPRLPGRANTNDRNPITKKDIREAGLTVQDAQTVVARWHGFAGWAELVKHTSALKQKESGVLAFELAVEAVIVGDLQTLKALLREHPQLIKARSTREHHATLLHYVGANGVEGYRQKTPKNAVRVLDVLLSAGAEVDADLDYGGSGRKIYPERTGSTTLGMVATSVHPAAAGVQLALLKKLCEAGASVNGVPGGWNPLLAALHNGRGAAAEFLAKRGARLDLEGAAGTGRLGAVKSFFKKDGSLRAKTTREQMEMGLMWACEYGRISVVQFLLDRDIDVAAQPRGETGLHWASYGGHREIVRLLLERGASLDIRDKSFGGTPLGWMLHGWCYPPPGAKGADYYGVASLLVKAGARLDSIKNLDRQQMKKLRAHPRMLRLIGAGHLG